MSKVRIVPSELTEDMLKAGLEARHADYDGKFLHQLPAGDQLRIMWDVMSKAGEEPQSDEKLPWIKAKNGSFFVYRRGSDAYECAGFGHYGNPDLSIVGQGDAPMRAVNNYIDKVNSKQKELEDSGKTPSPPSSIKRPWLDALQPWKK